ncbi:MAG: hypothetical protein ACRD2T_02680, partial [Thermoanaerobaculia bacterium]
MLPALTFFLSSLVAGPQPPATLRVPGEHPTIQAAIDAAASGDTVLLADGVHRGAGNRDLDFRGKPLHLRSENGPG